MHVFMIVSMLASTLVLMLVFTPGFTLVLSPEIHTGGTCEDEEIMAL
jgi:hypothetical protein